MKIKVSQTRASARRATSRPKTSAPCVRVCAGASSLRTGRDFLSAADVSHKSWSRQIGLGRGCHRFLPVRVCLWTAR